MADTDEFEDRGQKSYERWWEELQREDPSVTLVLRGHLLLEEEINLFFAKTLIHPQLIDKMQFSQKLRIFRAMQEDGRSSELWDLIELLTTLRNQTAHGRLEKNVKDRIATLKKIRQILPVFMPSRDFSQLGVQDIIILGFVAATSTLGVRVEAIDQAKKSGGKTSLKATSPHPSKNRLPAPPLNERYDSKR